MTLLALSGYLKETFSSLALGDHKTTMMLDHAARNIPSKDLR